MKNIMQAYELKGKIDPSGNLLITEPVNLPPQILTNAEELKQAFNNGTAKRGSVDDLIADLLGNDDGSCLE